MLGLSRAIAGDGRPDRPHPAERLSSRQRGAQSGLRRPDVWAGARVRDGGVAVDLGAHEWVGVEARW